jgi:hypothetical protein
VVSWGAFFTILSIHPGLQALDVSFQIPGRRVINLRDFVDLQVIYIKGEKDFSHIQRFPLAGQRKVEFRIDNNNYSKIVFVVGGADRGGSYQLDIKALLETTPPALITNFQASDNEDGRSTLSWTNPSDSDLAEVIVRRKTSSYPTSHNDGDLVYQNTSPTPGAAVTHTDTGLTNSTTYYYAVFSRDRVGNWNDQVTEGKNADKGTPQAPIAPTAHPWPMFGYDPQHTGQSPFTGPKTNYMNWHYQVSARYEPVIGIDGTIYIAAQGKLHAINPDGTVKWIYDPSPDVIVESPAIGPDGTIYAPGSDVPFSNGFLFAFNPDGSLKWKSRYTNLYWQGLLTIGNDGTIYTAAGACGGNREYYAISPDGSLKWTFINGQGCTGVAAPAVGPDGTVYAPTGGLAALSPTDGQLKWRLSLSCLCPPAIAPDGTIYLNAGDLHAINPDGTTKWIVPGAGYWNNWNQSPAIGSDGTIYSAGIGYRFHAINPDGTTKWIKEGLGPEAHIALSSDGILYFSGFGYWGAASTTNGEIIWTFVPPQAGYADAFASPAISADGTVYFSGASGLYAFKDFTLPEWGEITPSSANLGLKVKALPFSGGVKFLADPTPLSIKVDVLDLSGRPVFHTDWVQNGFTWNFLDNRGQPLANGVYLYVVRVRGFDGREYVSEVRKLVIVR